MDSSLLSDLTEEQKDLFNKEYSFIMKKLPLKRRFNTIIKKIITEGLIKRVKDNSGIYINNIYIEFIEDLINTPHCINGETIKRSPELVYQNYFNFDEEYMYYHTIKDYIKYYDKYYDARFDVFKREEECLKNEYGCHCCSSIKDLYIMWCINKEEVTKVLENYYDIHLFNNIIGGLLVYFMINNDLYHEHRLFDAICKYLLDNHEFFLDYYRLNYKISSETPYFDWVKERVLIVKDLVNCYYNGSGLENEKLYRRPIY